MTPRLLLPVLLLLLAGKAAAQVQVISYGWTGPSGNYTTSTVSSAYISGTPGAVTTGPYSNQAVINGFTVTGPSASSGTWFARINAVGLSPSDFTGTGSYAYNQSEADAKAGNSYYSFSFTTASTLSLGAFSGLAGGTSNATDAYQIGYYLVGSTDNFATSFEVTQKLMTIAANTGAYSGGLWLGDLSGVSELQNIAAGTTLSFRLYTAFSVDRLGNSTDNGYGNNIARFSNLTFYDAVPEPSDWALLSLGLGLLVAVVRRRSASA